MAYSGLRDFLQAQNLWYAPELESILQRYDYDVEGIRTSGTGFADIDVPEISEHSQDLVSFAVNQGISNTGGMGWRAPLTQSLEAGWEYIQTHGLDSTSQLQAAQDRIQGQMQSSQEQLAILEEKERQAQSRLEEQMSVTQVAQERAAAATEHQRRAQIRLDNTRGLSATVGITVGTGFRSQDNRRAVQYQSASDLNRDITSSGVDLDADDTQGPRRTRRRLSNMVGINI